MSHEPIPADLIHTPSFPGVTAQMRALIAHWEADSDRRCIFLDCYCLMTGNMLDALSAERFYDSLWVNALLHRFADYYFQALAAYEQSGAEPPAIWQLTHDAARRQELSPLQHLLLGVNAHINYDLALAVRDLLAPEWDTLPPATRRRRYEDHCRVNQIIAETIDAVQDDVLERYQPALDLVDKLFGPVDEWVTAHVIGEWRDEVWQAARTLVEAETEREREQVRARLERRALQRARLFLLA